MFDQAMRGSSSKNHSLLSTMGTGAISKITCCRYIQNFLIYFCISKQVSSVSYNIVLTCSQSKFSRSEPHAAERKRQKRDLTRENNYSLSIYLPIQSATHKHVHSSSFIHLSICHSQEKIGISPQKTSLTSRCSRSDPEPTHQLKARY